MPSSTDLRRVRLKATSPRVKILEILTAGTEHGRHLSAEDVYRQLLTSELDIGISTIYRVLNQLVDAGVLLRRTFEAGHAMYELGEGAHHDHLICLSCGRVEEFHGDAIESRQERVANGHGFALYDHALALYGTCSVCQASAGAADAVVLNTWCDPVTCWNSTDGIMAKLSACSAFQLPVTQEMPIQRRLGPGDEPKTLLARCIQQHSECAQCQLRAMCIHRPDRTGCNWSAESDFPVDDDDAAIRGLSAAKRLLTRTHTRYNVVPAS